MRKVQSTRTTNRKLLMNKRISVQAETHSRFCRLRPPGTGKRGCRNAQEQERFREGAGLSAEAFSAAVIPLPLLPALERGIGASWARAPEPPAPTLPSPPAALTAGRGHLRSSHPRPGRLAPKKALEGCLQRSDSPEPPALCATAPRFPAAPLPRWGPAAAI